MWHKDTTLERLSRSHLAQVSFKNTIFYRAFSKINAFSIFCPYNGFTLAEVLITLGIIGIVAAMTLPTIIQEHRHKTLETGLARFYTVINQAFKASELDNGEQQYWEYTDNSCEFYKKYLHNYLKTINYECGYYNKSSNGTYSKNNDERFVGIYFPSGDMAVLSYGTTFTYMVNAKNHYRAYEAIMSGSPQEDKNIYGRTLFVFHIARTRSVGREQKDGVEPFAGYRIYTDSKIRQNCIDDPRKCTELIRRNGWKIPKDYPFPIK